MTDIGFNYVPDNQRVPGVYPEVEGDIPGQPPQWTLMVGQSLNTTSSVPVMVSSVANAVRRFGAGSMLASMVERYLASDPNGTLWVLPLNNFNNLNATVGATNASANITTVLGSNIAPGAGIAATGIATGAIVGNINATTGVAPLLAPSNAITTGTSTVAINGTGDGSVAGSGVGTTASSNAITGLPTNAAITNGMTITGTNIPANSFVWNYDPVHGTALLYIASPFTGTTNPALPVLLSSTSHGVKAVGSIDFGSAAPNEDGVLYIYIAGRLVALPVANGQATTAIAINAAAAINGYFDANDLGLKKKQRNFLGVAMPVTASVTSGSTAVTLTANHPGSFGNTIDVQLNYYGTSGQQETPGGMTVTVTAMKGGALDPDTSGLDSILGDTQYDFIVNPYTTVTGLNDFQTLMSDSTGRWSPLRKVYGHVFSAVPFGANGSNAATFGTSRNDRHATIVAYEDSSAAAAYDVAAAYCGAFAAGSRVDPARPTQTLAVVDILAPHRHQRFSAATRQTLLGCGLALMDYNPDYTCKILRAVTTYQLDANGTPDIAYRDTETLYTLMAVVRQMTEDWGAAFPRAKILDDDTAFGPGSSFTAGLPDQAIVTIKSGKAVLVASYARMATGKGQSVWLTDMDSFKENLVLQRNSSDPTRLDALLPVVLASGLRVTAMKVDFALQGNA
jgi:phage tail sheath gpL-like